MAFLPQQLPAALDAQLSQRHQRPQVAVGREIRRQPPRLELRQPDLILDLDYILLYYIKIRLPYIRLD